MPSITPSEKSKANLQSAPKKCIKFVLDYSRSYHVVDVGQSKIGVTLN